MAGRQTPPAFKPSGCDHQQLFIISTQSYGSVQRISNAPSPPRPPKPHAKFQISSLSALKTRQVSARPLGASLPRLNSAAYQGSLVALTLRRTPSGDRKGLLCGISLSAGDQGAAFDYMSVTVGSGGTCLMTSGKLGFWSSGVFH